MIVYSILNQHNGKRYIGFTTKGLKKRRIDHLSDLKYNRHHNRHLQAAWNQGDRYFLWVILEVCSTIEDLNMSERKWIAHYNTINPSLGYNLTYGGEGGIPTQEIRQKMSNSQKGRVVTEETRERMRQSMKGKSSWNKGQIPWNKGKKMSKETRHKISESMTGKTLKPLTPEHRAKISAVHKGKVLSQETRARMSAAHKQGVS